MDERERGRLSPDERVDELIGAITDDYIPPPPRWAHWTFLGGRWVALKRVVFTRRCALCGRDTSHAPCIHGTPEALERFARRFLLQEDSNMDGNKGTVPTRENDLNAAGETGSPESASGILNRRVRRSQFMEFGEALQVLRRGGCVTRLNWNGKGQRLFLQMPGRESTVTLPYITIVTVLGSTVPWVASHTDLLASDWCEVVEQQVQMVVGQEHEVQLGTQVFRRDRNVERDA